MANLSTKIKLFCEANNINKIDFLQDVIIENNGEGDFIKEWNLDINQPSQSDLEQYNNSGNLNEALSNLRAKRDELLNQTDWIVIKAKETGTTIPTAWKTYRQSLRDITENLTTVEEVNAVVFPDKP